MNQPVFIIAEAGVKGYEADFSLILLAPKQVPDELVNKFRQAVVEALRTPEASRGSGPDLTAKQNGFGDGCDTRASVEGSDDRCLDVHQVASEMPGGQFVIRSPT